MVQNRIETSRSRNAFLRHTVPRKTTSSKTDSLLCLSTPTSAQYVCILTLHIFNIYLLHGFCQCIYYMIVLHVFCQSTYHMYYMYFFQCTFCMYYMYKRRDLRYRADLQLVGHVCRPFIIDVNCTESVWICTDLCGNVRLCVDLYEVA